jgi:hypothetical protein
LYTELWGKAGPLDPPIPRDITSGGLIHEYFPPVMAEKISDRIKKIRHKTAGGPDGIEKSNLSIPGLPIILAVLFNMIYFTCHYPKSWKENRTTLIPKNNKDLSKAENWRPITIGSIISRIFSSTLDKRIKRGIVQNIRQKGFTSANGCKINAEIVNTALKRSKRDHGGVFTIVDISKAFDTVPHSAIAPSLARKGISAPLIELINGMYTNIRTKIKTRNGNGVEIEILRGVKQGDPLSPTLFNLCLEPLLEAVEESTEGIRISDTNKIPILVFADDIVLVGSEKKEAQKQLTMVHEYLDGLGMSISGDKSQTF